MARCRGAAAREWATCGSAGVSPPGVPPGPRPTGPLHIGANDEGELEHSRTKILLQDREDEKNKHGCSIMTDAWIDMKRRSITNICTNSSEGTSFIKSKLFLFYCCLEHWMVVQQWPAGLFQLLVVCSMPLQEAKQATCRSEEMGCCTCMQLQH